MFERASYLPVSETRALENHRAQVLIGSASDLACLAALKERGSLHLSELDSAVFVITDYRDAPLNEGTRYSLWNAFSAPVYELVLSDDGALLAAECEAQDGWHVENGVSFSRVNDQLWYTRRGRQIGTGLIGAIDDRPCACGRKGMRIKNAAIDYRDALRNRLTLQDQLAKTA